MSKRNPIQVSDEERFRIREMYLSGIKIRDIAKEFDRYPDVVRHSLEKDGVYKNTIRYMSEEELNQIIADYQSGLTPKELSEKYHRSDGYLINKLKDIGVYQITVKRYSQDEWNQIAHLYANGNIDEIFYLFPNLKKDTLYTKMSKMGVQIGGDYFWSKDDQSIIRDYYYTKSLDELYDLIGQRHTKAAIQTFALKILGYEKKDYWTAAEEDILKKYYSTIPIAEVMTMLPNRSLESIRNRVKQLNLVSNYRVTTCWSDEDAKYLSEHWLDMSDYEIACVLNRTRESVKDRRNLLGLHRTQRDFQKYASVKRMLRGQLWDWKQKSMEECNYQCVLTGSKDYQIHHLYSFNDIFYQFSQNYNLKSEEISDYSLEELPAIIDTFQAFHAKYPLGVCIRSDLHTLFHEIYGKSGINPDQWEKFKNNYQSGLLSA